MLYSVNINGIYIYIYIYGEVENQREIYTIYKQNNAPQWPSLYAVIVKQVSFIFVAGSWTTMRLKSWRTNLSKVTASWGACEYMWLHKCRMKVSLKGPKMVNF